MLMPQAISSPSSVVLVGARHRYRSAYAPAGRGAFEQDTSAVLFLFGETYYLAKEKPSTTNLVAHDESAERPEMVRHKGEVYGVKSRQAWTMEITLLWLGSTMSYQDMLSDERREL